MSSSVIKNSLITPMGGTIEEGKTRLCLMPGYAYLVKDNVEKGYEVFMDLLSEDIKGLCVTRKFPPKVRQNYGLKKTPIVWLTEEKVEGETTVYSLQDLSILIKQFLESADKSVVLLDGFEFLIVNHGFDPFIRFLQLIRSRFELSGSILIAPILEGALDLSKAGLIEREMKPLNI